ncbi:hypothetical protein L4D77_18440 [Photobacterium frigidiphilum]|uniref:hypothetical protein n=1 Tax=Photobacterium frigidiphilum TaxID=264736 RepID=UPI003D0EEA9E
MEDESLKKTIEGIAFNLDVGFPDDASQKERAGEILAAFCTCVENKIDVPESIMTWISDGFSKHLLDDLALDKALNRKSVSRKSAKKSELDEAFIFVWMVDDFMKSFQCDTPYKACLEIKERLENNDGKVRSKISLKSVGKDGDYYIETDKLTFFRVNYFIDGESLYRRYKKHKNYLNSEQCNSELERLKSISSKYDD